MYKSAANVSCTYLADFEMGCSSAAQALQQVRTQGLALAHMHAVCVGLNCVHKINSFCVVFPCRMHTKHSAACVSCSPANQLALTSLNIAALLLLACCSQAVGAL